MAKVEYVPNSSFFFFLPSNRGYTNGQLTIKGTFGQLIKKNIGYYYPTEFAMQKEALEELIMRLANVNMDHDLEDHPLYLHLIEDVRNYIVQNSPS